MTENNPTTPEPIEVPMQEPSAGTETSVVEAKSSNGTRTLLEIGGAAIAVVLIAAAAVFGFVAGRVTDGGHNRDEARMSFQQGPGQGPGQGRGMHSGPEGLQGPGGMQRPGGMEGPGGMQRPGMPDRGVDPDGDDWTGQNQQPAPSAPAPAPSSSSQAG